MKFLRDVSSWGGSGLAGRGLTAWTLPLLAGALLPSAIAVAQTNSLVQATPPAMAVERLNQNLTRLARQPTDMEALLGAGMASYELGDAQAANGFFTRANLVNPRNGRAKLGLALVSVALKQPREAATYFDDAAALGEPATAYLPERALAYDLTGQQDKAQRDYETALRATPGNSDLIRAYAVSLGISGKVDLAEAQLRPLLFRSDRAAWRDRTMILAMNGRTAEARKIAQTIMPRSLADGMEPYLIRMGSLTASQKAAATHYGQFPAEGLRVATMTSPPSIPAAPRTDVAIRKPSRERRKVAEGAPIAATEDNSLMAAMPRGDMPPAMVQPVPTTTVQPIAARPVRDTSQDDPDGYTPAEQRRLARTAAASPAPISLGQGARVATASPPPAVSSVRSAAPGAMTQVNGRERATASLAPSPASRPVAPVTSPVPTSQIPPPTQSGARMAQNGLADVSYPANGGSVVRPVQGPSMDATPVSAVSAQASIVPPATGAAAVAAPSSPINGAAAPSLATATATATVSSAAPQPGFSVAPVAGPAPAMAPRTLASIMAEIQGAVDAERSAVAPAVDLDEVARIQTAKRKAAADKAKKDAAAKLKAEADAKAKAAAKAEAEEQARIKANPPRIWIQVATGRDPAALAFDMRRLRKTYSVLADQDASTAEWGATRRLLVGPYASVTKAKAMLTDLKKAGSDGFVWQSEAGETVTRLSGK